MKEEFPDTIPFSS